MGHTKSQQCKQRASTARTEVAQFNCIFLSTQELASSGESREPAAAEMQGLSRAQAALRPCWHAEQEQGPQSPAAASPDAAFPLSTAAAHEQIQPKLLDLLRHRRLQNLPCGACHATLQSTDKNAELCHRLRAGTHQL